MGQSKLREYLVGGYSRFDLAWRVLVDGTLVNAGLLLGSAIWIIYRSLKSPEIPLGELLPRLRVQYLDQVLAYNLAALLSFLANGVYGRIPTYRGGRKALVLARAVGFAFLLQIAVIYFLGQQRFIMRGSVVAGWAIAGALLLGARLGKMWFGKRFQITPRRGVRVGKVAHVLVVGGAGYIGSVLVRWLLERGYRVRVLDKLVYGDGAIRELYHHPDFEFMKGDFRHVEAVVRAIRGTDAVIHLGAIVGDPACQIDSEMTLEVNYIATRMIREVCKGSGIQRFLFASTCSVYGAADQIINEESPLSPVSLYATSKIDAEKAILDLGDEDFRPTVLRIATAFGWSYRPRFDLVINLLTAKAAQEKKIQICNGEQWRPFIHVRDIARAFITLLEAPLEQVGNQVFNVGDDRFNMTLSELGNLIARQIPEVKVEHVRHGQDQRNYRVSFAKIAKIAGFRSQVPVTEGVEEIARMIAATGLKDYADPKYSNVATLREDSNRIGRVASDAELVATHLRVNGDRE